MKEIPKAYEPKKYEEQIYKAWEMSGFFNPDNFKGQPYSIMMPPPNVTGVLHLGHALENSLMDVMARYQRLRGKKVLLLPGTDHAAVATQAKVEKLLQEKGIKNPRAELGREKLLKEIKEYAENSKKIILRQIKKMGTSCDWSRLAYTFDEKRNRTVNEIFKKMYNDGLIYRGFRAVNWSVRGQSTLSDDEIVYQERASKLYTFKYSANFPITIATTRPETKLGDTAVAINLKDKRYKKYIGKEFDINFVGQKLHLKIIADKNVAIDFGTGALGVTPAHSMVDYEMGVKNKLPIIKVIGEDGKMTGDAGSFAGMSVEKAREEIIKSLKKAGLLLKEEDIKQNVGTSDRFGDVVEVLPKEQWFVSVDKKIPGRGKTLKQLMKEAVKDGVGGERINITPKRFEKIYFNWINNLRDWCISRQIWWGHRISVYYRKQVKSEILIPKSETNSKFKIQNSKQEETLFVGDKAPGKDWVQDEDTLDTWFSSGLWTFSTLGWPDKTKDLQMFHPTNWMQMGHEILFFWMARMILMSSYALNQVPFKDVYIHGILRDENGEKFSKSKGNVADPLDVIEKYGTDALRFSLLSGAAPGNDQRFYYDKVEGARNLVNKLWNIARFIAGNQKSEIKNSKSGLADKWILSKLNNLIAEVVADFDNFRFSQAAEKLREFTWSDFADWYIEISKIQGNPSTVRRAHCMQVRSGNKLLLDILEKILVMWHPFMPFVTEVIWSDILGKKNLMIAKWPKMDTKMIDKKAEKDFEKIKDVVIRIRNLRAENKVNQQTIINSYFSSDDKILLNLLEENQDIIKKLVKTNLQFNYDKNSISKGVEIRVDTRGSVDIEKEKNRLIKELQEKEKYYKSLKIRLKNNDFTSKAPKEVVEVEKERLAKVEDEIKALKAQLKSL